MEQMMRQLINDIYRDLEDAIECTGEKLDAETLADVLGDRMYDYSEEYRNTPWAVRRAMTMQIASEYV